MVDALAPLAVAVGGVVLVALLWRKGKRADQSVAPASTAADQAEGPEAALWKALSEGRDPTAD